MTIQTDRLDLIPGSIAVLEAELHSHQHLEDALGVRIPASWPPPLYDAPATEWTIARIHEDPEHEIWGFRYFVLRQRDGEQGAMAVGAGGYKGPPREDSSVEIGYSILPEHQGRGYATEAAAGLVRHAFSDNRVRRVVAETLPDLQSSIRVVEKLGFRLVGAGSEEGVVRYEVTRDKFLD